MSRRNALIFLQTSFFAILIWSVIKPHDLFTWFLEMAPAGIGYILCLLTYRRFPFSLLAYTLMWMHSIVLLIGAHWTYAEVPLFNWIRDTYQTGRNSYDGVGHFAQGFFPAIYAREILTRKSPLKSSKWLPFLIICVCLAFSAFYELIEWWVSIGTGSKGDSFLGTQGDIFDTQKDMCLCLIGSIVSLLILSKAHDRSMEKAR